MVVLDVVVVEVVLNVVVVVLVLKAALLKHFGQS